MSLDMPSPRGLAPRLRPPTPCPPLAPWRLPPSFLFPFSHPPPQLIFLVAPRPPSAPHNPLRFSIHRHLRVIPLHETTLMTPVRHDPTVRVRKIALRFRLRDRFLRVRYLRFPPSRLLARARL